ncbi:GNAT family N-acetyltransferase [Arthrobacter agilis]|uniref:GNAT family N-acetyltransferase n=1 Tax=Arthrobacter agilis TaxID=37921 RepID=UPI002783E9D8|nr:N-acetyltransferase [Arthrobacter agilis]MDQ0734725.1 putative GNAT family acetyltransferase [Arthrobacter agilis]
MTELLHPTHTEPSTTTTVLAPGSVTSLASFSTRRHPSKVQATGHVHDSALLDDALSAQDLAATSTKELRVMVNQAYKLMDTDCPPAGAIEHYEMIVEELEHRAEQAAKRDAVHPLKETFSDNRLYNRFELFIDGTLAACVRYTMKGGQILLLGDTQHPRFCSLGIDNTLMRHIVLNAHKRRLELIPRCPLASAFLANHPHYQHLAAQPRN